MDETQLGVFGHGSRLIFCHLDGSPIQRFDAAWRKACRLAGIEGFRFHDLRHTFCSNLKLADADIKDIKEMIGHGDIAMTDRYTHLPSRKESVLQVSNYIGHNYALRILPYRRRVRREYYVRGTDNFETGKRRAQTGDWNGAAELWEIETANAKSKIAGRACYNMGIINEINGDLDAAVDWTSKSYTDHKNKEALDYLRTLRHRIEKNAELRAQLE